ncbi:YciI family protein [Photobacterium chitinilyticum]|uniref:GTP cyclohydrolase n=1 Tax=Photobacterium chitinilyticum TaxID=2485123 RepID=A0A3S4TPR3_9GAMM|nr:YciI family protein [Photobacterium chitinilyticum]RWX57212.1 GTP cyclohydrolase [Photobacterium chitinilyticum]
MFVVSLTYVCEMSEVEKYLDAHIDYLEKEYKKGSFIASGRKVPRIGGVILANVDSLEQLTQILDDDPFKQHGLAEYEVTEFIPSKTSKELDFLRQQ